MQMMVPRPDNNNNSSNINININSSHSNHDARSIKSIVSTGSSTQHFELEDPTKKAAVPVPSTMELKHHVIEVPTHDNEEHALTAMATHSVPQQFSEAEHKVMTSLSSSSSLNRSHNHHNLNGNINTHANAQFNNGTSSLDIEQLMRIEANNKAKRKAAERLPSFDSAMKETIERARANEAQRQAKIVAQMEAQYEERKRLRLVEEQKRLENVKMMARRTRFKAKKITGSSSLSRTRFNKKQQQETNAELDSKKKERDQFLVTALAVVAYLVIFIWYLVVFVDFDHLFGDEEERNARCPTGGKWFLFCYDLGFDSDMVYMLTVV